MCLLGIALGVHARYPVVVAANRDEFFHRPAAPAEFWPDLDILAGRDLDKGGTWMGLSRRGSLAAITNFRDPSRRHPAPRSRGLLVRDCLTTTDDAATLAARAVATGDQYDGFNLLVADHGGVWFASNRGGSTRLDAGIHAISNGGLDDPWPKVRRIRTWMANALLERDPEALLFDGLGDSLPAPDAELPSTGVGLSWERLLSPVFIRGDGYGTRSSTVVLIDTRGHVRFVERTWNPAGQLADERRFHLRLASPVTA